MYLETLRQTERESGYSAINADRIKAAQTAMVALEPDSFEVLKQLVREIGLGRVLIRLARAAEEVEREEEGR